MGVIDFPSHAQTLSATGQVGRFIAGGKKQLRNASKGLGNRYWEKLPATMQNELHSQHARALKLHEAHVGEWAASLANYASDARNAIRKIARATAAQDKAEEARDVARQQALSTDPKVAKRAKAAVNQAANKAKLAARDLRNATLAKETAIANMGKWYRSHAPHPIKKAEDMFAFTLANGKNYADVLGDVKAMVDTLLEEAGNPGGALHTHEEDAKLSARNTLKSAVQDAIKASGGVWDPFGNDSTQKALYTN